MDKEQRALTEYIIDLVYDERDSQISKWGYEDAQLASYVENFGGPNVGLKLFMNSKMTVLMEEVGEVARAILERDYKNLFDELIQTAAVCVAMAEVMKEERFKNES